MVNRIAFRAEAEANSALLMIRVLALRNRAGEERLAGLLDVGELVTRRAKIGDVSVKPPLTFGIVFLRIADVHDEKR